MVKKDGITPKLKCSGTIVDEWFILTAAHCVKKTHNLENHSVVVGSTHVTDTSEEHRIEIKFDANDVFAHPSYLEVISSPLFRNSTKNLHIFSVI